MATSFLGSIALAFRETLAPLDQYFHSAEGFQLFLQKYGWDVDAVDSATMPAIRAGFALKDLFVTVETIAKELEAGGGESADELTVASKLIEALIPIIDAIRRLATNPPNGLPFPLDQNDFWQELPLELVDDLFGTYLEAKLPVVYGTFVLLGLAEMEQVNPAGPGRISYRRRVMHWDQLGTAVTAPQDLLRATYRWNDPQYPFKHERLVESLQRFFWAVGVPARLRVPPAALLDHYYDPSNPVRVDVKELRIPIISRGSPLWTAFFEIGMSVLPIPPGVASTEAPVGWLMGPIVSGSLAAVIEADSAEEDGSGANGGADDGGNMPQLFLDTGGGFEIDDAFGLELRPDGVRLVANAGSIDAKLAVTGKPTQPWILLGAPSSHRLELGGLEIGVGVRGQLADPEFLIEIGTGRGTSPPKLRLVIQTTNADGFLHKLFGDDPQSVDFTGSLLWSSKTGFAFSGTAGFTFVIPLNVTLGGLLTFETLYISLGASDRGAALVAAVTVSAEIGPISASVEQIGIRLSLLPLPQGAKRGSFGDLDVALSFKPPKGLGIQLDAGPITGGGFIEFDETAGRYVGVLALSLYSVQVKAIGLLDTKLPGGEPGYSFLVIISVEFSAIQLGFGFTLNGVGGLCGINRSFVTEALRSGLRTHSLDHILFPKDPVKNAPAIISDLRSVFPPAEGFYVFGPMVELGWGGGINLLTAELGIIVAIPSPVIIAILGQLNVLLPDPAAPLIELHLDVLGIIDFGKKLFSLDATLHDSRVVIFTIFGDMAMRLSWGDKPSFALSIGGLNPHFQPPDGFPSLKRLTIALSSTDNFRLSIQTYLAITSNTFQFGAKAELYAGAGSFNVYGWLGFDALFIFDPFSFLVEFTAGLALRSGTDTLFGISVDGLLSGPTPWHVSGNAHISLFFFEISVHVEVTWGEQQSVVAPPTDAWPPLLQAIQNVQNWSGSLPSRIPAPVTLSTPRSDPAKVYVDPSGVLTLRERVLPLNQALTKFGEAVPGPQTTFSVDAVTLGGQAIPFRLIKDKFAPAQFEQMRDQEKLSRPSFEDRVAGFSVGEAELAFGHQFGLDLEYVDIYIDDLATAAATRYRPTLIQQAAWARTSGASASAMRAAALGKYAPPPGSPQVVTLDEEQYVVASADDLSQRGDITGPVTKGEAFQALKAHLSGNPSERGRLQVVPLHELAA